MARIYYGQSESYNGNVYRVEIWDEPSGSAVGGTELILHGRGIEFQYQGQGNKLYENTILPSRASAVFNIDNETAFNFFTSLGVEDEGQYAMVVFKDNVLWWVGRILSDQNQYDKSAIEANLGFKVTSVDTLNLMKDYYVDPSWFGSSKRLNILAFIRECFTLTGLTQYWTHIAPTSPFLIDAYQKGDLTPFDQYLVYLELNLISVIKDFTPFYNQETTDSNAEIWIDCRTAIENILQTFNCQIRLSGGAFWIWSIYDIGDWTDINYVSYNSALGVVSLNGQLVHSITIGTGNQRNRFEKYATFGFQPPLREIQTNYEKLSMVNEVRVFDDRDSAYMEAGPLQAVDIGTSTERSDITLKATINIQTDATTNPIINHGIYYNYYCYNSGTGVFKNYDVNTQSWVVGSGIGDTYEVDMTLSSRQQISASLAVVVVDFFKVIKAPDYGDELYVRLSAYEKRLTYLSTFYSWVTSASIFYGNISLIQKERKPSMTKTTNSNSTSASEIYEYDAVYGYSATGWQGISARGIFYNTDTETVQSLSRSDYGIMALYNKAVKTLEGTWHDSGTYLPVKTILIGSELYAFNGGTYSALGDVWDGEWLLIEKDFTPVLLGDEQTLDETDDQTREGVQRLFEQLDTTRESVSNIPNTMPYLIAATSVEPPDALPIEDTYFGLRIKFTESDSLLNWSMFENGKSVTFTAGEDDVEGQPDIILCDTTAGAIILNLPLAADAKGIPFVFKKTGIPHSVTISAVDIDGAGSYVITDVNDVVTIKSNGTSYYVVGGMGTSGSGSGTLGVNITSNTNFGGNASGDTYTIGESYDSIFQRLLVVYIAPIFATLRAKYASSTLSTSDREIGTTFNVDEMSVNITGDNPDGDPPTSVSVTVSGATTGSGTIASGLSPAVGTGVILDVTDGDYKRSTNGAVTFTVSGLDAEGGTVTTNIAYQFKSYNYFGGSATVVIDASTATSVRDEIKLQRKALDTDRAWSTTGSTETNDGTKYSYIMYPASYGNLTQVLQGAFNVLGSFTLIGDFNILTENGAVNVSYRVYQSNATGAFIDGQVLTIS